MDPFESKLQAMGIIYLRGVQGVTRRDRITNDALREELWVKLIMSGC